MKKLVLQSKLSFEDLIKNWDSKVIKEDFNVYYVHYKNVVYIGKRSGNSFILIRKAPYIRNNFATIFRGNFYETSSGSAISGHFSKFYSTIICGIFMFTFCINAACLLFAAEGILIGLIPAVLGAAFVTPFFIHREKNKTGIYNLFKKYM